MPSGASDHDNIRAENEGHWSFRVEKVVVSNEDNSPLNLTIDGGSDNGEFVYVGDRTPPENYYLVGRLNSGDIVLEIQGQKTAGYTQRDVVAWLNHCCRNGNPVTIKTIPGDLIAKDLRQYLSSRFPKGSPDHDLQNTIRDNLYLRTVPCTTRPPRDGEVNGVDYCFLSPEEFMILERTGKLLESGIYEGNHYGTPKPPKENPVYVGAFSNGLINDFAFLPGAHPSSEGKRRRNRSNVEAMSGNSVENKPERESEPPPVEYSNNHSISSDTLPLVGNDDNLGPLPQNWEKAYTEKGEPYFIDHTTGTSHWLDPRLAKVRKKTIEDCNEDELPYGWEKIDDPNYGTYYIDHVNRKTQYENPVLQAKSSVQRTNSCDTSIASSKKVNGESIPMSKKSDTSIEGKSEGSSQSAGKAVFTRNPADLKGELIRTMLVKSNRGFGFTIVGGDDDTEEFLQIKSVVPNGPAWIDGRLKTGDVLVYVNDTCVLGYFHHDIVTLFQSFVPGETVELEVCRGYPLQFDLDDPNNEIVTTVAVSASDATSANGIEVGARVENRNGLQQNTANSLPDLNIHNSGINSPNPSVNLESGNQMKNAPDILDFQPLVPPKPEFLVVRIVKGNNGFGFTIADSAYGQKVKKILDHPRCQNLLEGDILVAINDHHVKDMPHSDVVQVLKNCPQSLEAAITVQRGANALSNKTPAQRSKSQSSISEHSGQKMNGDQPPPLILKNLHSDGPPMRTMFRSKTPNPADLYSSRDMEVVIPNRPKTPVVDTRLRSNTPSTFPLRHSPDSKHHKEDSRIMFEEFPKNSYFSPHIKIVKSPSTEQNDYGYRREPVNMPLNEKPSDISPYSAKYRFPVIRDEQTPVSYNDELERAEPLYTHSYGDNYPYIAYDNQPYNNLHSWGQDNLHSYSESEHNTGYPAPYSDYRTNPESYYGVGYRRGADDYYLAPLQGGNEYMHDHENYYGYPMQSMSSNVYYPSQVSPVMANESWRKQSTSFEHEQPSPSSLTQFSQGVFSSSMQKSPANRAVKSVELTVTLVRKETGFGFRIVGGTEEGSQVSVGHIVPGGAADLDGKLKTGDEIISIDGLSVLNTSHRHAVQLMGNAAGNGHVILGLRRIIFEQDIAYQRPTDFYPYDVTVTRKENEGFGFVIISSVTRAGSAIGRIMENSPAERCSQLHIGDRILAVNGTDIMNLHHGEIVNLIKDSGYSVTLTIGPPQDDNCSTSSASNRGDKPLEEEQYFAVELTRGTRGFGFSIRGGKEFQNMPLFVLRIADVGPAAQDGRLKIGDQIIEINGINTKDMTHSKAIDIIKQGGSMVRLLVKRGGNKLPISIEQANSVPTTPTSPEHSGLPGAVTAGI